MRTLEQRRADMQRARAARRPPGRTYTKNRKERGPTITPDRLVKAIRGSHGNKSRIGRRLSVTRASVCNCLKRPGPEWEKCRLAYDDEIQKGLDDSEKTMSFLVKQRDDYKTAFAASKFLLSNLGADRGFLATKNIILSGGKEPIKLQHSADPDLVDIDSLPLELRKQLLACLENTPAQPIKVRVKRISG